MQSQTKHNTKIIDVLVIGSGGAGLRAAIEVKLKGQKVHILGKRCKKDAHTKLAAGGINAAFGNIDSEDSWEQHFIDTYLDGYEIGNPDQIEIMAKEAPILVKEIDKWGANFEKIQNNKLDQRYFGAHQYRRTCYSGDYTGLSILNTLLRKSEELDITISDSEYVSDLLLEDRTCFGAMSFNTVTSDRTVYLAKAVILCTGGHTKLWKRSSSRDGENTGDGYHLALKAGCELIDMEMVQFHPSGMLFPEEMVGNLVTEAVRGEGGLLFNNKGERFMINYDKERMELSTRDKVTMANYNEIMQGRGTKNGGVYLDISHLDKAMILKKLPKIYKQFLESQMLDISEDPMEVAPTAHYSMGGIVVNAYTHSTQVKGLYAAGEVVGGLHGANRLGGNSLAEILVSGRRAGMYCAEYTKDIDIQRISNTVINRAHQNINKFLKRGNFNPQSVQNSLGEVMWEYCGVIRNKKSLLVALEKIQLLKEKLGNLNVIVQENNCNDLINALNLESSLITAEATIISAMERKESIGANQRSDFPSLDPFKKYNLKTFYNIERKSLELKKVFVKGLKKELQDFLNRVSVKKVSEENKLIE